jgi:hypothetical protein
MKEEKYPTLETRAIPAREKTDRQSALDALGHYRRAQEYLKLGNWASYGEELKKMDEILRAIEKKK